MTVLNKTTTITTAILLSLAITACNSKQSVKENQLLLPVNFEQYNSTAELYVQRESDINMEFYFKKQPKINEFLHLTTPIPIDAQSVVRSNNDTLYSLSVVDARGGFSVDMPDVGERYQSTYVLNRDHYPEEVFYGAGTHQVNADTDYVFIVVRTQFNPYDQKDIDEVVKNIQPKLNINANSSKPFSASTFDMEQHVSLRKVLEAEASELPSMAGMMAKKGKVDPWLHVLGAASGWGLLPDADASYIFGATEPLAATGCFTATYTVPPVDGFWSITMYDKDQFLYSDTAGILNGYNVKYNEDGTFTVHFGSVKDCGDVNNRLDITEGWNFLMRVYKPRLEELANYKLPKIKEITNVYANTSNEIKETAEEAYLYGLQQVIYYGQRWTSTQNNAKDNTVYTGLNRFSFVREKITPDFPIVTPNATTLYGSAYIDLRKEPVVLEMPEISDRYYSAQVMDQYGIFHTMVGSPFNGTKAQKYIFVPPGYKGTIPADFTTTNVIQWPSKTAYVFIRIALKEGTEAEVKKINNWQDQTTVTLVSNWLENGKKGVSQKSKPILPGDFLVYSKMKDIAKGQVDKQSAEDYFTILNMVLNDPSMVGMTDSIKEAQMLTKLEKIGIGKGKDFNWNNLPVETQEALDAGHKASFSNVRKALMGNLINLNGWMEVRNSGGFETQWLDRAIMADAGWAGPDRNVSHTGAFLFTDNDGNKLNGKNNYTLTFDMNDLPPVDEFWSVPIYNQDGYFVRNAIDRYTINSFMVEQGVFHIENNKLVIYVQNEKPTDPKKFKNWLPSPSGIFRFTARFYHPKMNIIDGSYMMPKPVLVK